MSKTVDERVPLGQRVRAERARRAWSLTQLAEASGVSRAMISRIERAESSPTAVILGRLSAALELSMSTLLAPAAEETPDQIRRDADTPTWTDPDSGYLRRQISTPGFPADVTEILLPPGAEVPMPAGSYAFIAQLVWVLDGELTLVDGPRTHHLSPGDTFELGEPRPRRFINRTAHPCRYLVVVTRTRTA